MPSNTRGLVAEAETTVVAIDPETREARPIPEERRGRITAHEGRDGGARRR